jgi:hypothetical protein
MSSAISMLNEYCQHKQLPTPVYSVIKTEGPSHIPVFTMKVTVGGDEFIESGNSKKVAKYKCANKAVQELNVEKHIKDRLKEYKYRICELKINDLFDSDSLEILWEEEDVEEVLLTIKRSNHLDDHDLKTIKLKIIK